MAHVEHRYSQKFDTFTLKYHTDERALIHDIEELVLTSICLPKEKDHIFEVWHLLLMFIFVLIDPFDLLLKSKRNRMAVRLTNAVFKFKYFH